MAPTETGTQPRLTFQEAKLLGLHPGARTLDQIEMRLSPAGKKELICGLPVSIPLERS